MHFETMRRVSHMALFLSILEQLGEAKVLACHAVLRWEVATGLHYHPTFMSIHTLGKVLRRKGQYKLAAGLCRCALNGFVKILGPSNRWTLRSLQSLGLIEEGQGYYSEAEVSFVQIADGNIKVLGQEHRETRMSMDDLERVSEGNLNSESDQASRFTFGASLLHE